MEETGKHTDAEQHIALSDTSEEEEEGVATKNAIQHPKKMAGIIKNTTAESRREPFPALPKKTQHEKGTAGKTPKTNTTGNKQKTTPPPIVLTNCTINYSTLCVELSQILENKNFRIHYNKNQTKIFTNDNTEHSKVCSSFKANDISFHTFAAREDRTKKIVLKAAPGMDVEDIKSELQEREVQIKNCIKLKGKNEEASYSYLITTPKEENVGDNGRTPSGQRPVPYTF